MEFSRLGKVYGSHGLMVYGRMMFGDIVSKVSGAGGPMCAKLFLILATTEPMKTHVHCFGAFGLYCVGDDTESR